MYRAVLILQLYALVTQWTISKDIISTVEVFLVNNTISQYIL